MPNNGRLFNVGIFARDGANAGFQKAAQVSEIRRGGFGTSAKSFRVGGGS